jgi:uncharacterized protein
LAIDRIDGESETFRAVASPVLSPATHSAAEVIRLLALEPLPREGGWFRRVAESDLRASNDPDAGPVIRPAGTTGIPKERRGWSSIYALFTVEDFSALHRLTSDEIWFFHAGDPLESLRLFPDGRGEWLKLGLDPNAKQLAHDIVRAGTWQGTRLQPGGRWALVSCVVVPEFSWDGFELAVRSELVGQFPNWASEITALTRIDVD